MTNSRFLRGNYRTGSAALARQRGFVLVAFSLALLLILGCVGLAFDMGRMYITKNESQSFCDSAAIAAALKLNGSDEGIDAARTAALNTAKGWNFGTQPFNRVTVDFATSLLTRDFVETPANPANYIFARVRTSVDLPMSIMPVVTGVFQSSIAAVAVAKQSKETGLSQNTPPLPFGVLWIPPEVPPVPGTDEYNMIPARYKDPTTGEYIWQHGGMYTLRGPASLNKWPDDQSSLCASDATELMWALRQYIGEPERGYLWPSESAASVRDAIEADIVPANTSISVGDPVTGDCSYCRDNGVMATEVDAINARVGDPPSPLGDTDPDTVWYTDYIDHTTLLPKTGNGRRVVTVPLQTAFCGGTFTIKVGGVDKTYGPVPCPTGIGSDQVAAFLGFFLHPDNPKSPQKSICAEYIGPLVGNTPGNGLGPGVFTVKLVE